jgi:hypothetical protein|tara:strand:- start:145 stop:342 length:198 start_codon:yes stop_codon:yes gene_type:complete
MKKLLITTTIFLTLTKAKYIFEDVLNARQRAEDANANSLIPDASNEAETSEGRAENRRVEILIVN